MTLSAHLPKHERSCIASMFFIFMTKLRSGAFLFLVTVLLHFGEVDYKALAVDVILFKVDARVHKERT